MTRLRTGLSCLLLTAGAASSYATGAAAQAPGPGRAEATAALVARAAERGRATAVVVLDVPPAGAAGRDDEALGAAQAEFAAALDEAGVEFRRYQDLPLMLVSATAEELALVQSLPGFRGFEEPELSLPTLDESVPLVDAPQAWSAGFLGQGQAVAILDTGVDVQHPAFAGRIVAQACFSTGFAPDGSTSLCPDPQADPNAADDCPGSVAGCGHGTHVAGIAAGDDRTFRGVAPKADIIAVRVFSRFDDRPGGPTSCADAGQASPCALSYRVDQIRALRFVAGLAGRHDTAAVNMSLGGGRFAAACDTASQQLRDTKAAIDLLRSQGTATVVASGNAGFKDAIGAPACISSAFSVGNTPKADNGVRATSNSAGMLSFLAPGTLIEAAVDGGGFDVKSGTSMAAPHVAGAWAVLASADPGATPAAIADALRSTGKPITDSGNGITRPRVDVGAAVEALLDRGGTVVSENAAADAPAAAAAGGEKPIGVLIYVAPGADAASGASTEEALTAAKERVATALERRGAPVQQVPGSNAIRSVVTPELASEILNLPEVTGVEKPELSTPDR
jgi:subtilisin